MGSAMAEDLNWAAYVRQTLTLRYEDFPILQLVCGQSNSV